MVSQHPIRPILFLAASIAAASFSSSSYALSLSEAEQLALTDDPQVAYFTSQAASRYQQSIADAQLDDPRLNVGLFNIALDNPTSFTQEPNTQFRVGISQSFPRGDSRLYLQQRGEHLAKANERQADLTKAQILQTVRLAFFDKLEQQRALQLIADSRVFFEQLIVLTEAYYGSGRVSRQDVVQARLELSRLDDRILHIKNQQARYSALLQPWVGWQRAQEPLQYDISTRHEKVDFFQLSKTLEQHESMQIIDEQMAAAQSNVDIALEQYKPSWTIGTEYRQRSGSRTDQAAITVSMDLPWFTEKRQDKRLSSSRFQYQSVQWQRNDQLRQLHSGLKRAFEDYRYLNDRVALFENTLIPESKDNSAAALSAYQNGVNEFSTLIRARITELDVALQQLSLQIEQAKAYAQLQYYQADQRDSVLNEVQLTGEHHE